MILCHCAGVTEAEIGHLIRQGAESLAEIARRCGAGQCCMPCREEIAAMLARASATADDSAVSRLGEGKPHEGKRQGDRSA